MDKKRVYVSSTYKDLIDHRRAVKAALERAGYDVECMEKYPAFDERPKDKCLADVADCDFYLLILAWRYGYRPPEDNPSQLSITHLEYEHSVQCQKKPLVFLLDPDFPWARSFTDPDSYQPDSAIAKFRDQVSQNHGLSFFTDANSLSTAILQALRSLEQKGMSATARSNAQIRERYLEWLCRTCQSVELLGLDLKDSQNVRLGQIYVPAVTIKGRWQDEITLLLKGLGKNSLYVPGAPGAGKSTFCRWLALVVAGGTIPAHSVGVSPQYEERLPNSLRGRFPLLCPLREWPGEFLQGKSWKQAELEASLGGWLDKCQPGGLTAAAYWEQLKAGRVLLILDGVDEVPESLSGGHLPRHNLITGLADALPQWLKLGNRVLLTSRPYGLSDDDRRKIGLSLAEMAELPEALQQVFVRRWYAAADPPRANEKAEGLLNHLAERGDLKELRRNPMLLTALCVMYDQGQRLPQDFSRLYEAVVNQVLYKRYYTENDRDAARRRLAAVALGMHQGLDGNRTTPAAQVETLEIDRHLAALSQTDPTTESGAADAAAKREDLYSNSGLLLPRSNWGGAFYHLSFQEYLAAVRLHTLGKPPAETFDRYSSQAAWHRTLMFLFCTVADKFSVEAGVAAIEPLLEPTRLAQNLNPALLLMDCLEVAQGRGWTLEHFLNAVWQASLDALIPAPKRLELWLALGQKGLDQRPGVGLKNGLPDIDWVTIQEGPFLYGEGKIPKFLPTFHIARYPVTNSQFQAFFEDQGYQSDVWWQDLTKRPIPKPGKWNDCHRPRETVSWFEAVAFCRWLDVRLRAKGSLPDGMAVRLPTEEEWEKAARGTDGLGYPWGNEYLPNRANVDENTGNEGPDYLKQTSVVGLYPLGKSPFGVLDMTGNVWEWCVDKCDPREGQAFKGNSFRLLRGGSWYNNPHLTHASIRNNYEPVFRYDFIGFRLVCSSRIVAS